MERQNNRDIIEYYREKQMEQNLEFWYLVDISEIMLTITQSNGKL